MVMWPDKGPNLSWSTTTITTEMDSATTRSTTHGMTGTIPTTATIAGGGTVGTGGTAGIHGVGDMLLAGMSLLATGAGEYPTALVGAGAAGMTHGVQAGAGATTGAMPIVPAGAGVATTVAGTAAGAGETPATTEDSMMAYM